MKRLSKLKCSYVTNENPFLIIGPIKQEEVFDTPKIWIFYDVITEEKINLMKKLALPKVSFILNLEIKLFNLQWWNVKCAIVIGRLSEMREIFIRLESKIQPCCLFDSSPVEIPLIPRSRPIGDNIFKPFIIS